MASATPTLSRFASTRGSRISRIDATLGDSELFQTAVTNPTLSADILDDIAHSLALSDLDIKLYLVKDRGTTTITVPTSDTDTADISWADGIEYLFIEGAAQIGTPDVITATGRNPFFVQDTPLPVITAQIAQQGAVPLARIVNNTVVGRGGDLLDGESTAMCVFATSASRLKITPVHAGEQHCGKLHGGYSGGPVGQ